MAERLCFLGKGGDKSPAFSLQWRFFQGNTLSLQSLNARRPPAAVVDVFALCTVAAVETPARLLAA